MLSRLIYCFTSFIFENCSGVNFTGTTAVYSTDGAFLALKGDAGVCWGDSDYGGNCSGINFTGTTAVYSTGDAFYALLREALRGDGTPCALAHHAWAGTPAAAVTG